MRLLRRLNRGPFEAAVAFAAVVAAVAYAIDPGLGRQAAVGHTTRLLLPWWEALYGVGGAVVLLGMLTLSLRAEVTGLLLLAAAIVMNAISIGHYYGARGVASAATFAALCGACVLRAGWLWRRHSRVRAIG